MMSSFPSSSLIRAARGIPLIATPSTESASICRFSSSSSAMSDIAAAMNPMRFPYTPTDRHPIFTSFGGSPPFTPRVSSQVTVSADRCNSSAISFSERPFSLYSMALFAIAFTSFIRPRTPGRAMRHGGYQSIALRRFVRSGGCRLEPSFLPLAELPDFVVEDLMHILHRQGARVQDRVVEELVREGLPQALPHVVAQFHDEMFSDQVGKLVCGIVRVPLDLGNRPGPFHACLANEQVDGLVERHLARVEVHVDEDPARPDRKSTRLNSSHVA